MEDDIDKKQQYLRTEILDKGYDPKEFNDYICSVRNEENIDLNNWTLEELKNVVKNEKILSNFTLNIFFIKLWWSIGAAIATLFAEFVVTLIMAIFVRKDINFLKLFFRISIFKLTVLSFKLMFYVVNIKIINQFFNLINFKSTVAAGFSLEFHNPSTLWA